jgi:hypothetical protein
MSSYFDQLQEESEKQRQQVRVIEQGKERTGEKVNDKRLTRKVTRDVTEVREPSRDNRRDNPREFLRDLPTRHEIQEFSFSLRDELKVKVQAEVPYQWQQEFEDLARDLKIKKLELYRFILGEFLGKVKRQKK